VQIPNLAGIPIYRITPEGRNLVNYQKVKVKPPGKE
jgi:hypothetical protein